MRYEHTQFGYVIVIALATVLLLLLVGAGVTRHAVAIALVPVIGLLLWQMSTLTTSVDARMVQVWFGPGLIRRRIPLTEIEGVSVVRNAWLYGWGIRLTPRGWLWRVSGLKAVRLRLTRGRHFSIGSDEPDRFAAAIEAHLSALRSSR